MPTAQSRGKAAAELRRAWHAHDKAVKDAAEPLLWLVAAKIAGPLTIYLNRVLAHIASGGLGKVLSATTLAGRAGSSKPSE